MQTMTNAELDTTLTELIARWESECVEFKEAGNSFDTHDIGKYFSALANEANLRGYDRAWLVFGVRNKDRKVVGTNYRPERERLNGLKHEITQGAAVGLTFRNIHELHKDGHRVLLFEIPAAPRGLPVSWKGHRYARAGESLTALGTDKEDEIRRQTTDADWSALLVPSAGMKDIEPAAIAQAREQFARKFSERIPAKDIARWTDETFLERAKLTIDGAITRTCLLLLGRAESTHFLSPHPVMMTWQLKGEERAYEHFGPPFLLNTSALFQRIRNIKLQLQPMGQLLPLDLEKYDRRIILEALHNCVAHQDYRLAERVLVTESADRLVFENAGNFFEGIPDDYVLHEKTPRRYRNPFLADAMVNLRMIDRMGYGIHDMFTRQRERFFPLSDFDLSEADHVRFTVYGRFLDERYSQLLLQHTDLTPAEIVALDRVQKGIMPDDGILKHLRSRKLIEGRKPNFRVASPALVREEERATFVRNRGNDFEHYRKLVLDYVAQYQPARRQDLNGLLVKMLPATFTPVQKESYVHNLLTRLRKHGELIVFGRTSAATWNLPKTPHPGWESENQEKLKNPKKN
jgi:ATP-dependent DNA helicase RecG